jgi:hypothetical protein
MKMKQMWVVFLTTFSLLAATLELSQAAFDSGSTGADGELVVSQNTELQLPESGVFNFTTVNVQAGATLTFKENERNTAVTILASGDVTIAGTISVNGKTGNYIIPGESGPGGYAGGVGGAAKQVGRRGEGPGGGLGAQPRTNDDKSAGCGGGGGFATSGAVGGSNYSSYPGGAGGSSYGNERILPLVGGSGGAGGGGTTIYTGGGGGGGGGAIVIASSGNILVTGSISANGGAGTNGEKQYGTNVTYYYGAGGGGGAGGGIRLIANTIGGNGAITANGGAGGWGWNYRGGSGSAGRIRFEAAQITRTVGTSPGMSMGYAYAVTPPEMPVLKVVSIAGVAVPDIPKGDFGAPDVILPYSVRNPITIVVQASNVPVGTQVTIKSNPAIGTTATASAPLAGSDAASSATIDLTVSIAYPSVLTAYVTYQLIAANGAPFFINGEKVGMVKVIAGLDGPAQVIYITESGKEIPATI